MKRTGDNSTASSWIMKGVIISIPVWLLLIVDTILLKTKGTVLVSPALHVPGWAMSRVCGWTGHQGSALNMVIMCLCNCLFYYVILILIRRMMSRFAGLARRHRFPTSDGEDGEGREARLHIAGVSGVVVFVMFIFGAGYLCYELGMNVVPIQVYKTVNRNPVSYVFAGGPDALQDAVMKGFSPNRAYELRDVCDPALTEHRADPPRLVYYEATALADTAREGATRDAPQEIPGVVLLRSGGAPMLSPVYHALGKPLFFRADFRILFEPVGEDSTRITVVADNVRVLKGIGGWGHSNFVAMEVPVKSSSTEEYVILHCIGSLLGASPMPAIVYPESQSIHLWWDDNRPGMVGVP